MLQSMTAFVRHSESLPWGNLEWEIRSLNYRYLEVDVAVPSAFRHLETLLREIVRQQLRRGRINCKLTVSYEEPLRSFRIDKALLGQLITALQEIRSQAPDAGCANDIDLLRWPGVMLSEGTLGEQYDGAVHDALSKAVGALVAKREREGSKLQSFLARRLDEMQVSLDKLKECVKNTSAHHQASLLDNLQELINVAEISSGRLEQEVAFLVSKYGISEEMERLAVHLADAREMMAKPGPHGRQLDFLMQEMNREANTIGSKVHQIEAGRIAIRLRTSIDQVREQVQNIE